jgi:hypothetical protein
MKSKIVSVARITALVLLWAGCRGRPVAQAPMDSPHPHPQIAAAITSLQDAREHLNRASHDFGGHRGETLKAIDEAIAQLQICMQYRCIRAEALGGSVPVSPATLPSFPPRS